MLWMARDGQGCGVQWKLLIGVARISVGGEVGGANCFAERTDVG